MKKILIMLVGILSFIGISSVKADTLSFSNYYENFDSRLSAFLNYKDNIEELISLWEQNYSSEYPYYFITTYGYMYVLAYSSSNTTHWSAYRLYADILNGYIAYNYKTNNIIYNADPIVPLIDYESHDSYCALINHGFIYNNIPYTITSGITAGEVVDWDSILFPAFTSTNYDFSKSSFEIEEGDLLPSYVNLYNGTYSPNVINNYTEINLNNYPYVALSLKDYTEREEFYTNVEVQGQYCLTSVYNYGLTEKKDIINGYKSQRCSPYYENYTPVRTYILESDLENHAIYYLKAYDTTKDNKVKVDTSIFNIHYITSEDEDNPILNINGRSYTPIPYGELSDSATISEEEGYVSGVVCAVGDFNCTHDVLGGHSITDIFNKPLEFFKNLIESFVSVFTLVALLIAVLPLPMQWFLYLSFTLAIALGIIKIIL